MLEPFDSGENKLTHQFSTDDPTVLETLIRSYFPVLSRYAQTFLSDASLADDVTQEAFIKLWKSAKTFESLAAVKAYLYTTTRNGCYDVIRSRNRMDTKHQNFSATNIELSEPVLADIIKAESIALLYQEVKKMPAKMQQVFLLSYQEGMTVGEISNHLNMNLKAVKKQKYKALVALRAKFKKDPTPLINILTASLIIGEAV